MIKKLIIKFQKKIKKSLNLKKAKTERIVAYTAILASVSTVITMIFSLISIQKSTKQFTESNQNSIKQIELFREQIEDAKLFTHSQLPASITLEPKYVLNSKNGDFIIKIINNNLYDLTSLSVSKNCYQAGWDNKSLTNFTVNYFRTIPNKVLDTLKKGESYDLIIDKSYLEQAIVNPPSKKQHANFLKLTLSYERVVDKKTFFTNKLFHMVPNNTIRPTTFFDEKEDTKIKYGSVTFKEIKEYLGVETE